MQIDYKSASVNSSVWDTGSYEQWEETGGMTAAQRANTTWKQQLADYQAPAIDPAIDEALIEFVTTRKASMPDSNA